MVDLTPIPNRSFQWGPKVTANFEALNEAKLEEADVAAIADERAEAKFLEVVADPEDATVAALVEAPASATARALNSTIATSPGVSDGSLMVRAHNPDGLSKVGPILRRASTGFDSGIVESPAFYIDPTTGIEWMVYVAYDGTNDDPVTGAIASVGRVRCDADGYPISSTREQFFTASGVVSSADEFGTSGPVPVVDGMTLYLFYIGLTQRGYENGTKTLCLATLDLTNQGTAGAYNWTRLGPQIAPQGSGWASEAIFHPNFVKRGDEWLCFINADGAPSSKERVGLARADALTGPWTLETSPLFLDADFPSGSPIFQGDPFVWWWADRGVWRMDFFMQTDGSTAFDSYATTTAEAFPYGWEWSGVTTVIASEAYDQNFAHKPSIALRGGDVYHYYTAVGTLGRVIALATSGQTQHREVINLAETTRNITATTLTDVASTTAVFPTKGRRAVRFRAVVRGFVSTGGTLTMRPRIIEPAGAVGNGSSFTTTRTAYGSDCIYGNWEYLGSTGDALVRLALQAGVGTSPESQSAVIGQVFFEIEWM